MIGVCMGGMCSGSAATDPATTSKFLQLNDAQRYWYLEGAVSAAAHLAALNNRQVGECAGTWYLKDRTAKRKLIEDTLAQYPQQGPTTIVISLMTQACGQLVP